MNVRSNATRRYVVYENEISCVNISSSGVCCRSTIRSARGVAGNGLPASKTLPTRANSRRNETFEATPPSGPMTTPSRGARVLSAKARKLSCSVGRRRVRPYTRLTLPRLHCRGSLFQDITRRTRRDSPLARARAIDAMNEPASSMIDSEPRGAGMDTGRLARLRHIHACACARQGADDPCSVCGGDRAISGSKLQPGGNCNARLGSCSRGVGCSGCYQHYQLVRKGHGI